MRYFRRCISKGDILIFIIPYTRATFLRDKFLEKFEFIADVPAADPSLLVAVPASSDSRHSSRGGALQRRLVPCPPSFNG